MIDAREREALEKGMRVIWIIWGAMFASLGIYIIVGHMVIDKIKIAELPSETFSLLRNVLYVVALVELALIPFIRKMMLKGFAKGGQLSSGQALPGTGNHPAIAQYAFLTIVTLALAESVAIYGLPLLFLGMDLQSLYILTALSAAAMIVHCPKMEEVERLATGISGKEGRRAF